MKNFTRRTLLPILTVMCLSAPGIEGSAFANGGTGTAPAKEDKKKKDVANSDATVDFSVRVEEYKSLAMSLARTCSTNPFGLGTVCEQFCSDSSDAPVDLCALADDRDLLITAVAAAGGSLEVISSRIKEIVWAGLRDRLEIEYGVQEKREATRRAQARVKLIEVEIELINAEIDLIKSERAVRKSKSDAKISALEKEFSDEIIKARAKVEELREEVRGALNLSVDELACEIGRIGLDAAKHCEEVYGEGILDEAKEIVKRAKSIKSTIDKSISDQASDTNNSDLKKLRDPLDERLVELRGPKGEDGENGKGELAKANKELAIAEANLTTALESVSNEIERLNPRMEELKKLIAQKKDLEFDQQRLKDDDAKKDKEDKIKVNTENLKELSNDIDDKLVELSGFTELERHFAVRFKGEDLESTSRASSLVAKELTGLLMRGAVALGKLALERAKQEAVIWAIEEVERRLCSPDDVAGREISTYWLPSTCSFARKGVLDTSYGSGADMLNNLVAGLEQDMARLPGAGAGLLIATRFWNEAHPSPSAAPFGYLGCKGTDDHPGREAEVLSLRKKVPEELGKLISEHNDRIAELGKTLEGLDDKAKTFEAEKVKLEDKKKELEDKKQELEDKKKEPEDKKKELEDKKKELEDKKKKLEDKKKELEAEKEKLETEKKKLKTEKKKLETEKPKLEAEKVRLEAEKAKLEAKVESAPNDIAKQTKQAALDKVQSEQDGYRARLRELVDDAQTCDLTRPLRLAATESVEAMVEGKDPLVVMNDFARTFDELNLTQDNEDHFHARRMQVGMCAATVASAFSEAGPIPAGEMKGDVDELEVVVAALVRSPVCWSLVGEGYDLGKLFGGTATAQLAAKRFEQGDIERLSTVIRLHRLLEQESTHIQDMRNRVELLSSSIDNIELGYIQSYTDDEGQEGNRALEAKALVRAHFDIAEQGVMMADTVASMFGALLSRTPSATEPSNFRRLFPALCDAATDSKQACVQVVDFSDMREHIRYAKPIIRAGRALVDEKWAEASVQVLALLRVAGEQNEEVDRIAEYLGLFVSVVQAKDADELAEVLSKTTSPPGAWRRKQVPDAFTVSLTSFVGLQGAAEWRRGQYGVNYENGGLYGQAPTLAVPIGIDVAWGVKAPNAKRRGSIGAFFPVIDPAAFLQYSVADDARLPGPRPLTVVALGAMLRAGLPNTPVALLAGYIYRPQLRSWSPTVNGPGADAHQLALMVAIDATLWTPVKRGRKHQAKKGN